MSTHPEQPAEPDPDLSQRQRTTPPGVPPVAPTTKSVATKTSLSTRTGYAWTGLVAGILILILLLIFIVQNLEQVQVHFFFWDFSLPLGVTVLLSMIGGAAVMASVGGVRILQLRRAAKKG
ncbi:LapA family protein [Nocardia barduliensis]|uniref:LapA family protein n=1 Tax=Nocardia barduliensis TaxID=2736643 RepID=UPI001574D95A|nr:lipopolysaccharide assembly protein LapA domain-containing protein [Nocardia barduliensis]